MNYGLRHFRVLDCWFDNKEFMSFMRKSWDALEVSGRSNFVIKNTEVVEGVP